MPLCEVTNFFWHCTLSPVYIHFRLVYIRLGLGGKTQDRLCATFRLVYIRLSLGGKAQDGLGASLPYLGILSMSAKE